MLRAFAADQQGVDNQRADACIILPQTFLAVLLRVKLAFESTDRLCPAQA